MATLLKKPVTREVRNWCRKGLFGLGGSGGRALIVSLEPGPVISFREKGCKKRYDIDIERVFNLAVRQDMLKRDAEKKKRKKARK